MKYVILFIIIETILVSMAYKGNKDVVLKYYTKRISPNYYAKRIVDGNGKKTCYMGAEETSCLFYDDIEAPEVKRE